MHRKAAKSYQSLAELVQAQSDSPYPKELPEKFDLLLLGDGHPANIESAQTFIDEVYHQLPKGTTLGIVGRLASYLQIDWNDKKNASLHSIGFMNQLCNLYEFTRLLVLPDVVGEGIPIKTDDAIAAKVPFIATRHALRGFEAEDIAKALIHPVDGGKEMLSRTEALLADENEIFALSQHLTIFTEKYNYEKYFSDWNSILKTPESNKSWENFSL